MNRSCRVLIASLALCLPFVGTMPAKDAAPATVITATPDRAEAIYGKGDKITWTVDVATGDRTRLTAVNYIIERDGMGEYGKGTLDLSKGPQEVSTTFDQPCVLTLVTVPDGNNNAELGKNKLSIGGALVAPKEIGPSLPAPADFDEFWQAKLKDLAAVPANPVVQPVEAARLEGLKGAETLDFYKVTLDNINGTKVQGQLARPKKGEKFPALLILQYAGVYPLDKGKVVGQAASGWLVFNIQAHDIPIDEPKEYYTEKGNGDLKGYIFKGNESRDTSYFLRMYLGCVRAAEYLTSRPDWNGQVLVVTGDSQGGMQSFATAALYPKVTGLMTLVPAGSDFRAPMATPPRAFSYPYWLAPWAPKDHDIEKVKVAAGYFDGMNFAARVKVPCLIAVGLIDETSRPTGVTATYNAVKATKELVVMPGSDHHGRLKSQAIYWNRYNAWKKAFETGGKPPAPESGFTGPGPKAETK
ncbi:MAG: acetylxylan esterase [Candidatus Methylacidiphilales bacterium]